MRAAGTRLLRSLAEAFALAPIALSLIFAGVLSVAAFGLWAGLPLAYLLIAIVTWLLANYLFEVIEHRATSGGGWPTFSLETMVSRERQIGVVFALLAVLVGLACWTLATVVSIDAAWALGMTALVVSPAAAALFAVTHSPLRALNLYSLVRVVARLGIDYLLLLAATAAVAAVLGHALRHWGFLEFFAGTYLPLLLGYFLGGVIYAHRLALGVHAPRSPEAKLEAENRRLEAERRRALDHAYGLAAHGNLRGALGYLATYASSEPDPVSAKLWMFREMTDWLDTTAALELGRALIAGLESAGRRDEAAKIASSCEYLEMRARRAARD